jgi:hypothetical protein
MPDRFPRSLMFSMTASVPSYTPVASLGPHIAVLVPGLALTIGSRQRERNATGGSVPAPQRGPSTRVGRPLMTHGTSTTGSVSLHPFRLRLRARTAWWLRPAPTLSRLLPASPPTRGSTCLQLQPVTAMTSGEHLLSRETSAPRGAPPDSSMKLTTWTCSTHSLLQGVAPPRRFPRARVIKITRAPRGCRTDTSMIHCVSPQYEFQGFWRAVHGE